MRKLFNIFIVGTLVFAASSCKKYLDINDNPNSPTTNTPALVLPQALATTAGSIVTYNDAGAWMGGNQANAGGVGGWGTVWSYNYTTATNNGMWTGTYNNANDYQYIINNTSLSDVTVNFNAAARIMKSYLFIRLVDNYGNAPYSEALKGSDKITPKYDKDSEIYKAVYDDLTAAIAGIDANIPLATSIAKAGTNSVDILFGGDMAKWRAFANTLRLKILVKSKGTVNDAWAAGKTLTGAFLTDDALVQPGYTATSGKANGTFINYAYAVNGNQGGLGNQQVPTPWILSFYNGDKIVDNVRGKLIYQSFPSTKKNQLGYDTEPVDRAPAGSAWFTGGSTQTGAGAVSTGILKGINQAMPIMLASESYFLQAEAAVVGVGGVTASAVNSFNTGIEKSFLYLYQGPTNVVTTAMINQSQADRIAYQAANPSSPTNTYGNLVTTFPVAGTVAQQKEAIITQKYIALNFIHSDEGFAEFRRTGFPKITDGSSISTASFASIKSQSTRADKLPVRQMYPSTEYALNSANVPNVNPFTDRVFWDLN